MKAIEDKSRPQLHILACFFPMELSKRFRHINRILQREVAP